MIIDLKENTETQNYHLLGNIVIPRPIAWVATQGNVLNIAPFSFFNVVSSMPPTVIVSIGAREDGSQKDTLRNLKANKKCSISLVDQEHFEPMHLSSASLEASQSEFNEFMIESTEIIVGYPPIATGIKVAMFGEYIQDVPLKGSRTTPVLINISSVYLDEAIITDKEKLKINLQSIARLGGSYCTLGENLKPPVS